MKIKDLILRNSELFINIYSHPFNRALSSGNLPQIQFKTFLEQDRLYLRDYAKALQIVAKRLKKESQAEQFRLFAESTISFEYKIQANYLNKLPPDYFFTPSKTLIRKMPIIEQYTQHLLDCAMKASVEEAVVSLIPCFFIYKELGEQMQDDLRNPQHPYRDWIAGYSSEEYRASTRTMIAIADELNENLVCQQQKEKLAQCFWKSVYFEYQFFEELCTYNNQLARPTYSIE